MGFAFKEFTADYKLLQGTSCLKTCLVHLKGHAALALGGSRTATVVAAATVCRGWPGARAGRVWMVSTRCAAASYFWP